MKIVLIPETEEEKVNFPPSEHEGISEFFLCGKLNQEGKFLDFHDWRGSFRFLINSLSWHLEELQENRRQEIRRAYYKKANPEVNLDNLIKKESFNKDYNYPQIKTVELARDDEDNQEYDY